MDSIFLYLNNTAMKKPTGMIWKLGMFASIGFVLLVAGLFFIGKQKNLFGSVFHIRSVFSSVSGLKIGSNVRFGGINIGSVEGIQLQTDTSVMVEMAIKGDVRGFIKQDANTSIGSEGLMGDKVLVIAPGKGLEKVVGENTILISRAPIETDQILASLKISADNAALLTHNLAQIADKVNNGRGLLSRLIGDTTMSNNLNRTVANLKKGSEGLSENMEAAKHNFLLKGYFKKKKKEADKKEEDKKKQDEEVKKK
jgi:phospholipid/cholesterol/gamma-HCH transport system substrate-binding protein